MSARSRAFPWWGQRRPPRTPRPEVLEFKSLPPQPSRLFGYPVEYIDPAIIGPERLDAYQWRDHIVFGRVVFKP